MYLFTYIEPEVEVHHSLGETLMVKHLVKTLISTGDYQIQIKKVHFQKYLLLFLTEAGVFSFFQKYTWIVWIFF